MMSSMKLLIKTQVFDKNGKLKKTVEKESKSFVIGWMKNIEAMMAHDHAANADDVYTIDTSEVEQRVFAGVTSADEYLATEAIAGIADFGIVVGTGTTPPASENFNLETKIAHGIGATQLQYGQCTVNAAAVIGLNVDMTIVRTFTNGSGSTITVKEVGIIVASDNHAEEEKYFLIIRDAVNDAIANTETYVCTYTFRTTV